MVGLVHDHEVPAGLDHLVAARLGALAGEEGDAGEPELGREEGVFARLALLAGDAAGLVEDGEPEVEAAQQLDEPLVHERLGHEHERALGATDGEQALEDKAGLDGLAQADLVGEQHAR